MLTTIKVDMCVICSQNQDNFQMGGGAPDAMVLDPPLLSTRDIPVYGSHSIY